MYASFRSNRINYSPWARYEQEFLLAVLRQLGWDDVVISCASTSRLKVPGNSVYCKCFRLNDNIQEEQDETHNPTKESSRRVMTREKCDSVTILPFRNEKEFVIV